MTEAFKGITLFKDVEDLALRNHNRAVVMANLFEDNMDKYNKTSKAGLSLILGYFGALPEDERGDVYSKFSVELDSRGLRKLI